MKFHYYYDNFIYSVIIPHKRVVRDYRESLLSSAAGRGRVVFLLQSINYNLFNRPNRTGARSTASAFQSAALDVLVFAVAVAAAAVAAAAATKAAATSAAGAAIAARHRHRSDESHARRRYAVSCFSDASSRARRTKTRRRFRRVETAVAPVSRDRPTRARDGSRDHSADHSADHPDRGRRAT